MNSGAASIIIFGGCGGRPVIIIREANLAVVHVEQPMVGDCHSTGLSSSSASVWAKPVPRFDCLRVAVCIIVHRRESSAETGVAPSRRGP